LTTPTSLKKSRSPPWSRRDDGECGHTFGKMALTMVHTDRNWLVGALDTGDDTHFTMLNWDGGFEDPPVGYDKILVLSLQVKNPNEGGFHHAEEGQELHGIAEALVEAASGTAVEVGTYASKAVKNFCFYVSEVDWIPQFESTLRAAVDRRFAIKVDEDPQWLRYKRILADASQANSDRTVLDNLVRNGANLNDPRQTDWFLYFPTEDAARSAEATLLEHHYQVHVNAPDPGVSDEWCVIGTLNVRLSMGYIASMTRMFTLFAQESGGTYDGWGAQI
jgi:hypothetical protein